MLQLKILFADDQIPDKEIADGDIKAEIAKKHPRWPDKFINGFPAMRQTLKTLKDTGYTNITVARKGSDAMSLAKVQKFDLAIIDLRWASDESLSPDDSDAYGWNICDEIDKADSDNNRKPTPQIIYSSRVGKESSIGFQAAAKGKLPLLKTYNKAGDQALLASIKFIESLLEKSTNKEQVNECKTNPTNHSASTKEINTKVFVVHGKDEEMKQSVARTLVELGLKPLILHEQPNKGRTIIEKFTDCSDVGYAVVLLSPDDMAFQKGELSEKALPRARQNVILELGYFIGKLDRKKVMALYRNTPNFEIPTDFAGVVYTPFDIDGKWRFDLCKELKSCNYNVDANKLLN
jgi:predicted nucleotide-binding protein